MSFRLALKERKSPHAMERHPRYDVMVGDRKVDELYFNMTGYTGTLMNIFGERIAIGERGISTWKKEAAYLNREARAVIAANAADSRRISLVERTLDGDLRRLTFDSGLRICVSNERYMAGLELFGQDRLTPSFFEAMRERAAIVPHGTIKTGETWGQTSFVMGILETEDPDQVAVVIGRAPDIIGKIIQGDPRLPQLPEDWGIAELAAAVGPDWSKGAERVVFISRETMDELVALNRRDFMRADLLPGKGLKSERMRIFDEMITSTGQRPVILMDDREAESYEAVLKKIGYRFTRRTAEAEPGF